VDGPLPSGDEHNHTKERHHIERERRADADGGDNEARQLPARRLWRN
jgi:hypothetical protein